MKKKMLMWFLGMALALPVAANAMSEKMAQIYKDAEKEGQLLWTSTLREREAMPFVKAFNKEHPNIKASFQRSHGGQAMERLIREVQTGNVPYDVVHIHPDYMQEFLKMDVIEKVDWAALGVYPEFIHFGSRFVGAFSDPFVFVFNTNLVKKGEEPKTWEDFLDPKWKGKFVVDTRPSGFLRLTGAWGPEKVLDYLRRLRENEPIFLRGQTQTATLMAAGDYTMSVSMYLSSYVHVGEKKGGPLGFSVPNPVPTANTDYGIIKGIKNPNAAKVFLTWLGTKGFKLMDKVNWARSTPYRDTRAAELFKGKTLSLPPTPEQVPDRQKFTQEMLKALGVRKKKK